MQTLLLVAAADDSGHVVDAAPQPQQSSDVEPAALDDAERSGLLVVDAGHRPGSSPAGPVRGVPGRDQQGTPRSAPRAGRSPRPGRATRTGTPGTAPRPSTAPTPTVVADLTAAGARAERRGGYAAASAAYERAAELTAGGQPRAALLYAAARTAWAAGQTTPARTLSAAARELADDRVLRADIDRLRGRIEVNVGSATDAHHIFAAAARAVSPDDPTRALELAVAAALLSTYGADSGIALDTAALTADAITGQTPRTRCLGHLLRALTHSAAHDWAPALASLR